MSSKNLSAAAEIRKAHKEFLEEEKRWENRASWPNPKYLSEIREKYSFEYDLETFRKKLPDLYCEIFDIIFDRNENDLEAIFKLKVGAEIHDEVRSPVYLRLFSDQFMPFINKEIDAIFGFFGLKYKSMERKFKDEVRKDEELSDLIAFRYSSWDCYTFSDGGEEIEGDSYKVFHRCDVRTGNRKEIDIDYRW